MLPDVLTIAHPALLAALHAARTSVVLVSPYLTGGVALELARVADRSVADWTLLTNLDPQAVASGHLSTTGLRGLLDSGVDIGTLDRLHAKAYLADDVVFVGSGNLTGAGLGVSRHPNFELTTRLSGTQARTSAAILSGWRDASTPVTVTDLDRVDREAKALPVVLLRPMPTLPTSAATQLLADARHVNLWTKAVYGSWHEHDWSSPGAFFASSKRGRPRFAGGDLALIYVRDHQACASIVEVTGEAVYAPEVCLADGWPPEDAERWPWVNYVSERLTVAADRAVRVTDLGFTALGLENGHRRMNLGEFAAAVRAMTGEQVGR